MCTTTTTLRRAPCSRRRVCTALSCHRSFLRQFRSGENCANRGLWVSQNLSCACRGGLHTFGQGHSQEFCQGWLSETFVCRGVPSEFLLQGGLWEGVRHNFQKNVTRTHAPTPCLSAIVKIRKICGFSSA